MELFVISSVVLHLTKMNKDVIAFVTLLARQSILFRWISPAPPSHAIS